MSISNFNAQHIETHFHLCQNYTWGHYYIVIGPQANFVTGWLDSIEKPFVRFASPNWTIDPMTGASILQRPQLFLANFLTEVDPDIYTALASHFYPTAPAAISVSRAPLVALSYFIPESLKKYFTIVRIVAPDSEIDTNGYNLNIVNIPYEEVIKPTGGDYLATQLNIDIHPSYSEIYKRSLNITKELS